MNEPIDEKKITQLLTDFSELKFEKIKNPTFLEIIKQPKREIIWSNILAFYFDPQEEHGLYNLMLKSFFEALGKADEIKNYDGLKVVPEFPTDSRKRIDLVITGNNFVLGIENKVDYWLHNDLEDYSQKIDKLADEKGKECIKFKIILSKNHYHDERNFVNLSYDSFIKSIKKNLATYEAKANIKYLTFFKDFLRNIENTINFNEMIENKEMLNYFKDNYNDIGNLSSKFLEFKDEVRRKFEKVHEAIDLRQLDANFKNKFGTQATIYKSDLQDMGYPIFWIDVDSGINKITFEIYIEEEDLRIFYHVKSDDQKFKERIGRSEHEWSIEIDEETRIAAQQIVNSIEEIIGNVYVN